MSYHFFWFSTNPKVRDFDQGTYSIRFGHEEELIQREDKNRDKFCLRFGEIYSVDGKLEKKEKP